MSQFSEALSRNRRLMVAYGYLIDIASLHADRQTVKALMEKALKVDPASFYVRRSYLYSLQPKWGGSLVKMRAYIAETSKHISRNPRLKILQGYLDYTKANILRLSNRRIEAIRHLNRALQYGESATYRSERGQNYYFLKEYKKAFSDFDAALTRDPQDADILMWRARTLRSMKRQNDALHDLNLAKKLAGLDPEILYRRALVLNDLGKTKEAVSELKKALVFGRFDAGIWLTKGTILMYKLKDYERAVHDLKRVTELDPKKPSHWYYYAAALFHNRDCKVIEAAKIYLDVCNKAGGCQPERAMWARDVGTSLVKGGDCPAS